MDIGLNTSRATLIRALEKSGCAFGDLILFSYHAAESKKTMSYYELALEKIVTEAPNKGREVTILNLVDLKEKAIADVSV